MSDYMTFRGFVATDIKTSTTTTRRGDRLVPPRVHRPGASTARRIPGWTGTPTGSPSRATASWPGTWAAASRRASASSWWAGSNCAPGRRTAGSTSRTKSMQTLWGTILCGVRPTTSAPQQRTALPDSERGGRPGADGRDGAARRGRAEEPQEEDDDDARRTSSIEDADGNHIPVDAETGELAGLRRLNAQTAITARDAAGPVPAVRRHPAVPVAGLAAWQNGGMKRATEHRQATPSHQPAGAFPGGVQRPAAGPRRRCWLSPGASALAACTGGSPAVTGPAASAGAAGPLSHRAGHGLPAPRRRLAVRYAPARRTLPLLR